MILALLTAAFATELPTEPLPEPPPLFAGPRQSDLPPGMWGYALGLSAGRTAIGLAPIVAYEQTYPLLGFPLEHDNPSAQLMARLFGVRDIGLGVVTMASTNDRTSLRRAFLFNAATDLADATMIAIPLIAHDEIDPAARRSMGFALGGCTMWLVGAWWTTR